MTGGKPNSQFFARCSQEPCRLRKQCRGFTLLELLVSIAVLALIMAIVLQALSQAQSTWRTASTRVSQFRDARLAFELITRNVSQATLNSNWDYVYERSGTNVPDPVTGRELPDKPIAYQRYSDLQFFTGQSVDIFKDEAHPTHALFFQGLLGYSRDPKFVDLGNLLNGRGYYLEYGDDSSFRPAFLASASSPIPLRNRMRLMEFIPPAEENRIYDSAATSPNSWFAEGDGALIARHSRPIAENIIALVISPQIPKSTDLITKIETTYQYNSAEPLQNHQPHLLPPEVSITMVAIDNASAVRLELSQANQSGPRPAQLSTVSLMLDPQWFTDAQLFESDMAALEERLRAANVDYRVFTTTVSIRSSKWGE